MLHANHPWISSGVGRGEAIHRWVTQFWDFAKSRALLGHIPQRRQPNPVTVVANPPRIWQFREDSLILKGAKF